MFGALGEVVWWLTYIGMQIALVCLVGHMVMDVLRDGGN